MTWKSRLRFLFYGNSAWGFLGRVCILFVALWLGAMAYILSGKPVITAAPYEALIEDYLKTPPEQRAFPLYAEGFHKMTPFSSDAQGLTWGAEPTPKIAAELQAWFAANQDALALVHEAAKRPVFAQVPGNLKFDALGKPLIDAEIAECRTLLDQRRISSMLFPQLGQMRAQADLELRLAQWKAQHGDWQGFEEHVSCCLAMSRHLCQEKFLMSQLVGAGIRGITQQFLCLQLNQHPEMPETCLARLFQAIHPKDIQCSFIGEQLFCQDIGQRFFVGNHRLKYPVLGDDQILVTIIDPSGWTPEPPLHKKTLIRCASPLLFLTRDRRETFEDFGRSIFDPGERVCQDFYDFAAREDYKNADNRLMNGSLRQALRAPVAYSLARMTLPSLSYIPKAVICRAHDDGLRLALACELNQRKNGAYPASLDELKEWLPVLPLDPITRGPLHYKLVDGKPQIYSVGLDLDDDGGLRKYDLKDHMDKLNQNSLLRDKIPAPIDGDWILYPR